jgi:4,5-DOPA dioxygenase extradiol
MNTLKSFKKVMDELSSSEIAPALFIGHGSPMNAIEQNEYNRSWAELGQKLPRPKAILTISAHWLTRDTRVTAMERPQTIHDFGGFPQALFDQQYPAPGAPDFATLTKNWLPQQMCNLIQSGASTMAPGVFCCPCIHRPIFQCFN